MDANKTAYICQVSRPDEAELSGALVMLYVALTDTSDEALDAIRHAVKADATVELLVPRLSQQTASALDLIPGFARAL